MMPALSLFVARAEALAVSTCSTSQPLDRAAADNAIRTSVLPRLLAAAEAIDRDLAAGVEAAPARPLARRETAETRPRGTDYLY